jgi:hypothetical protein
MAVRMPTPVQRAGKSKSFWLRKRVPDRYREIVGRSEVWRSLGTSDERIATARCAAQSVELEEQWERRYEARQAGAPDPLTGDLPPTKLSHKEAFALAGECFREYVARHEDEPRKARPPINIGMPRLQQLQNRNALEEFLDRKKLRLDGPSHAKFANAFYEARGCRAITATPTKI